VIALGVDELTDRERVAHARHLQPARRDGG
jgi:hypothetical protein